MYNKNKQSSSRNTKHGNHSKTATFNKNVDNKTNSTINFQLYLYDKSDTFETLISKNDKLRLLVVQANNKINSLIKQQNEMENDYQIEKKSILQQLEKISLNYKVYATSHKLLKTYEQKMNNMMQSYSNLNEQYSRTKNFLLDVINNYYEVFKNINDYLKNSTQNDNNAFINQKEVFSYLIALRNKMYDNYNQMCGESRIISLRKENNSKLNSTTSRQVSPIKKTNYSFYRNHSSNKKDSPLTRSKSNRSFLNLKKGNKSFINEKSTNRVKFKNRDLNDNIYSDFDCQFSKLY